MRKYTIVLTPNPGEDTCTVTMPALPGCIAEGRTVDACIERAREAIALHIEGLEAHGEPVPEEVDRPQPITIEVAACASNTWRKR